MQASFRVRPVVGHESSYLITSDGRVFSKSRYVKSKWGTEYFIKGRWLKVVNNQVYPQVSLRRYDTTMVHRLVAEAFIPNPDNKPQVNHIDGNKHNNLVTNLEWVTHQENMVHAVKSGLNVNPKGENCRAAKLTDQEVLNIRKIYADSGYSQKAIGSMFNVAQATVSRIVQGKERLPLT